MKSQAYAILTCVTVAASSVFGAEQTVRFLPVMGNHDLTSGSRDYIFDKIVSPQKDVIKLRSDKPIQRGKDAVLSLDYHVDWKNARLIVVDTYDDFGGKSGNITPEGIAWVEDLIQEAMTMDSIDHVFLSLHKPCFPRGQHSEITPEHRQSRDALWNTLMKYTDKVRAVIVGHTHSYSRLRVTNPATADKGTPDHEGGIYEIDAGNAGVSGGRTTAVFLRVAGGDIHCVMVRIDPEAETAVVQDRWEINGGDSSYQGEPWTFSAIADPRVIGNSRKPEGQVRLEKAHRAIKGTLKELRDTRGAPLMGQPEFVVVAGDMSVGYAHAVAWQEIFGPADSGKQP